MKFNLNGHLVAYVYNVSKLLLDFLMKSYGGWKVDGPRSTNQILAAIRFKTLIHRF